MERPVPDAGGLRPTTRLRALRVARGLSQLELARRTGLTRQAVGAIEGARYVPNTGVALALARCLGCRVEDVFSLPDAPASMPLDALAQRGAPSGARVALAAVRGRLIGHPLRETRELGSGFLDADAVLGGSARAPCAELLAPAADLERTALLLGCDPALGVLAAHVERRNPGVRLRCLPAASTAALAQLRAGHAHAAGTHLRDPATGMHNLPQARRALAATGGVLVRFASWEQGLAVAAGNPRSIRGVADLARPRIRFVNRDPGSGGRAVLDDLLRAAGIEAARVSGYERVVGDHVAAAAAVAAGGADAAVTLRATAAAYGLGFVPLAAADFDLAIPADQTAHPAVATLLDVLACAALRRDLGGLAGYEVSRTGDVVAEVPRAQPPG